MSAGFETLTSRSAFRFNLWTFTSSRSLLVWSNCDFTDWKLSCMDINSFSLSFDADFHFSWLSCSDFNFWKISSYSLYNLKSDRCYHWTRRQEQDARRLVIEILDCVVESRLAHQLLSVWAALSSSGQFTEMDGILSENRYVLFPLLLRFPSPIIGFGKFPFGKTALWCHSFKLQIHFSHSETARAV